MNIASQSATVDLTGYDAWTQAAQLCTTQEKISCSDTTMQLPAYAVAVLIPKK